MRDTELPGDVTWPDTLMSELDDLVTNGLRQWTSIDKHAAELVQSAKLYNHNSTGTVYQLRSDLHLLRSTVYFIATFYSAVEWADALCPFLIFVAPWL